MKHRLALVTGATSGLGKALCRKLAEQGIPLMISARDEKELNKIAPTLPVAVTCHAADLSDRTSRTSLIEKIHSLKPDLVINNAGFGLYGDALEHSTQEQMEILEVNGSALLELSLETARTLLEHQMGGVILNVSSAASFFAAQSFAVYCASKAFVNQFSLAFDREVSSRGIRVLTACPGQIDTRFRARAAGGRPQKDDSYTMSAEKAAQEILWQIKKRKRLYVFDARYRIPTFIARHFLPHALTCRIIQRTIHSRLSK